ncbi:hypothetical protein [Caballeronia sp. LZ035]|uniref:hypothetical protein n=1 Tax=Caballeronia sp. LZ035 TaxID=3038568 RepID=UPI00286534B2|nr:hypothetical protein [Caballeronia sp. LZ035]MDR5761919.1 hypothetical protein [Caballeronia sp. LZ035]
MNSPIGATAVRVGTDWHFSHAASGGAIIHIQVTHECLVDALASDGTEESDRAALDAHWRRIIAIGEDKFNAGEQQPIVVKRADFQT